MSPQPVSAGQPRAPSQPNLVPAAARAQVLEANKLIAELNARPGQTPAGVVVQQQPSSELRTQPAPQPAVQPAPPQDPTPTAAAAPDAAELLRQSNARYASLQGKYNAEIAALRMVNDQQSKLVQQMLDRPAQATPAPAAPQSPEEYLRGLGATDDDIKDYGELLPIVAKIAKNMFQPTLNKLQSELQTMRESTGVVTKELVRDRRTRVYEHLDSAVANWRVINESEEFLAWLNVLDIFSGVTRRVALANAFENLDAARVAGIFEAYVREYPDSARASGGPQVDAATLVAPTTRGGAEAAPDSAGGKRIISEVDIRNFYARVRKKQVTPEEYQRFTAEIASATAEGRVRPDRPDHHQNGR